jgi:hypothetical protein
MTAEILNVLDLGTFCMGEDERMIDDERCLGRRKVEEWRGILLEFREGR